MPPCAGGSGEATVSLVAWYAVLGAVQVALALWVIFAQPRRVLNWAVGSLLLLWAGSGVAFQLMREGVGNEAVYQSLNRIGSVYEAPTYFLVLLVIDQLLLPARKPRAWRSLLVASGLALAVFLGVQATKPLALFEAVRMDGEPAMTRSTLLPAINGALSTIAQTAAVILAARIAKDTSASILRRRQAALVGLAFAILIAHSGAAATTLLLTGALFMDATLPLAFIGPVALATALYAGIQFSKPFHGPARAAIGGSVLFAALLGFASYGFIVKGFLGWGGRAIVVSAFSLVLAVALLRYDLAAARTEERRRLQGLATLLLGFCVAAILVVAAWSLSGEPALTIAFALAALLVPLAILLTPLKRLPRWVTRRVLLHPRDPEALRERVRMYAGTLRAATGPDGRIVAAAEATLAALRLQLGIAQRDHDLLVSMSGDQRAGGIVAYRLALVGAAADAEKLDDAQLSSLREQLNVTERDHALVIEHVEASAESLSAGALFLGRYHILRRLGEGGLGEVWLATDTREKIDVVLKHLAGNDRRDGAAWQRIQKEVRAARMLEHANIVAVRDVETVGAETYLVMEHMEGGSLADVIRVRGRIPEAEVVQMASEILDALGALHERGFVHRDVKPANIMLDTKGVAKLGDFNIARELVSGDTLGGEGARGPVGTFAYMPPEQARGLAARPQSDLYGLGATMYEAISGAPLLQLTGLSHTEAVTLISQQAPPVVVPHASLDLGAAISRALARLPEDRFADAAAMRIAISGASSARA